MKIFSTDRLRFCRKQRGLTQEQLAERFDAAPSYRADALRWYEGPDTAMAYDGMGLTARAAVRQAFTEQGKNREADAFLTALETEN